MSAASINDAIRDCLDRCYESDNATGCVAAFMQELRDSRGWTQQELHIIYSTVIRMLRALNVGRQEAETV
jgi:hypothetical protein